MVDKMSVRGSKNKIILYIAGTCSFVFVILLYKNASQRLEEMEKSYERCHLNEESLSAQLQVNLEYKVRLERSLQQEKDDHAQTKQSLESKLEEERQIRRKENVESNDKYSALQQQYKFLQSQLEDLNSECYKVRQLQVSTSEDKITLEKLVEQLKDELARLKENKSSDLEALKLRYDKLEEDYRLLKDKENVLMADLKNQNTDGSQIKLPEKLPLKALNLEVNEDKNVLQEPKMKNDVGSFETGKSSTTAGNRELIPSRDQVYINTSTPMINPDAVISRDKFPGFLLPQPKPGPDNFPLSEIKESVGAKPEEAYKEKSNEIAVGQGVLRAPDILKDFQHVPVIQQYKESLKQNNDNNNNGGEIGDEGEPVAKHAIDNDKSLWKEGEVQDAPVAPEPLKNEIPKNQVYHYPADYENRKEDGEDDDDVDMPDYQNDKNQQQQPLQPLQPLQQEKLNPEIQNMPFDEKRDSVMVQPR